MCVAVIAATYSAEVVARYYFNDPLNIAGDMASYLLCALLFLALPKVTSDRSHIAVSYFVERMTGEAKNRYEQVLLRVAGVICGCVACFFGIEAVRQFNEGILTSNANQIPKWWLSLLGCYGLASAALHLLVAKHQIRRQDAGL